MTFPDAAPPWLGGHLAVRAPPPQLEPWASGDAEPDGDWLNDSTRPLIHAIAPREAARLAVRTAEETDALPARPLDRLWPDDPDSPISPARGEHRGEHRHEIEAALAPAHSIG